MLYVTTRDNKDAYTAYKTLSNSCGTDGGQFLPFQHVKFMEEQLAELKEKSFCKAVAEVLNLFFSSRLDAWDVECCIGRRPVDLVPMSHKIVMCESWNNPEWDFSRFVRNLHGRLLGSGDVNGHPTSWSRIAIRIAFLFGVFGQLFRSGAVTMSKPIDIAVSCGDFTAPMAAWYARDMGLPIGMICFACNENSKLWDLLYHGQMHTADEIYTAELERLIYHTLGRDEVQRYAVCCESGNLYTINDEQAAQLRQGVFCAMVSEKRNLSLVRSIYRTNTYLLSPGSAQAFAGLQDYRAKMNETGPALILTEQGPLTAIDTVSLATGISVEELRKRVRTA